MTWRLVTALALSLVLPRAVSAADPTPPNIILILADDLGYGDLGCYGHPTFKTPNLDRMAAEGARLTQFNTPMPYCAPTRASLLTGRYPCRHGLTGNPAPDGGKGADALALAPAEVLLPQLLKPAGYATGMVGKWHLGHKDPAARPTRRGFDDYFGILYSNDMRPVELVDGDRVAEYPVVQATLTRRYTDRAVKFVEANKARPFFLYLAHAMPHKPLAASEAFYKRTKAGLYADVVAELDTGVGEVLAKVKDLGLDGRTLVVFASDNGPWFGGSTGGLRGMKSTTWEGGFRVPCVLRWPGRIPAGKVYDAPAVMMDLFATALAAAGVPGPKNTVIDGADLLPLVTAKGPPPHDVVFGHQGARLATVRDARWKLHVLPARDGKFANDGERWVDPRGPDGVTILAPYEQYQPKDHPGLRTGDPAAAMSLFDLQADPGEQHEVAAANPDVVAALKAKFDRFAGQFPAAK